MEVILERSDLLGVEQKLADYLVCVLLHTLNSSLTEPKVVDFATLLLSELTFILQSGKFPKVGNALVAVLVENTALIEEYSRKLLPALIDRAYLVSQWCHLLMLTNQTGGIHTWWEQLISSKERNLLSDLFAEIALVLLSDFFDDNIDSSLDELREFIYTNAQFLVEMSREPPVQQLVASVHRRKELSAFFNQQCCRAGLGCGISNVYNLLHSVSKSDATGQEDIVTFLFEKTFPLLPSNTRQAVLDIFEQNFRRHLPQDLWNRLTALISTAPVSELRRLSADLTSPEAVKTYFSRDPALTDDDEEFFLKYLCVVEDPVGIFEILQKQSENLVDAEKPVDEIFGVNSEFRKLQLATVALEHAPVTVYFFRKSVSLLSKDIPKDELSMYARALVAFLKRAKPQQKVELHERSKEVCSALMSLAVELISDGCRKMSLPKRTLTSLATVVDEAEIQKYLEAQSVFTLSSSKKFSEAKTRNTPRGESKFLARDLFRLLAPYWASQKSTEVNSLLRLL